MSLARLASTTHKVVSASRIKEHIMQALMYLGVTLILLPLLLIVLVLIENKLTKGKPWHNPYNKTWKKQ